MIDFDKTIHTHKVILRPMILEDFEAMKYLTLDKSMWVYFIADLSDDAVLMLWVKDAVGNHHSKKALPLAILDSKTKEIIGTTRIANISAENQRLEIGWTWIAKHYQGTGINAYIKKNLFQYLFTETPFIRIEFKTDVLNMAAREALKNVGLIEEGVLRSHTVMVNNRRRDTIYYSILKDGWIEM